MKNPIATTWLISFEQIRRSDALAVQYLSFMACINPRDIPQSLLPPGSSRKKEMDAIGTLTAYSFASGRPASASLGLHRLVHLTTRNWLRKEGLLSQWTETTINRLEKVVPMDDHDNQAIWRLYLPHAQQVLASNLVDKGAKHRIALMWRCGRCLYSDGRWVEAQALFTKILASGMEVLGAADSNTLATMADLASTYAQQGRWEEAEQLEVQVMEVRKTKLGVDHPDTLTSMANLAFIWKDLEREVEAIQLMKDCVQRRARVLGLTHPDYVSCHETWNEWKTARLEMETGRATREG